MRKLFCFAFALSFTTSVLAEPIWTKPGWYQVSVTFNGPEIEAGPFEDEESCKETLPDGNEIYSFSCERLDEKPEFDE